ncbi:hypothetical protein SELSPUOL_02546 [Selenomonas sputigena ATCC 35185]|uniref:Uncharacterized protein n=1 Tax=Selenomonas sputigena (strain ATCC 35185 / DSM 20758 / CCUG 44933 / VPI D19B-28) TaxID=546271 RepID=C9LYI5_SELS3|nr:hypothetical protein SELSPUOL_02546 [Selenomonas sputigena ATCC 35185]
MWILCAALNESLPIRLRPSGLTSWTLIVNSVEACKEAGRSVSYRRRFIS